MTIDFKLFLKLLLLSLLVHLIIAGNATKTTTRRAKNITSKAVKTTTIRAVKKTTKMVVKKSPSMDEKFEEFKKKYNKHYQSPEEEQEAKNNFIKSEKSNQAHNQRKNETYKRSTTEDSDKSYEWKVKNRMGAKKNAKKSGGGSVSSELPKSVAARIGEETLPESVDWSPWFSPIRDQSKCGSCWAFSTIAVLEYLLNVIRGEITPLSEQNLVDCDDVSQGCDGGWPTYALEYIIVNGIASRNDYNYLAYQTECIAPRYDSVLAVNQTFELELHGDEKYMMQLLFTYGPIIVVIWATDAFVQYTSGVYNDYSCPNDMDSYNHAIVIVGYGTDNSTNPPQDYWLIRNSWSELWGIKGYGKMARNANNLCGIANYAMLPSSTLINDRDIPRKARKN